MLIFYKRIGPGKTHWNMLGVKEFNGALNLILGTKAKNCSAAIPDCSRKCAVNAANSVIIIKTIWKLPHQIDKSAVKIPEYTKSR